MGSVGGKKCLLLDLVETPTTQSRQQFQNCSVCATPHHLRPSKSSIADRVCGTKPARRDLAYQMQVGILTQGLLQSQVFSWHHQTSRMNENPAPGSRGELIPTMVEHGKEEHVLRGFRIDPIPFSGECVFLEVRFPVDFFERGDNGSGVCLFDESLDECEHRGYSGWRTSRTLTYSHLSLLSGLPKVFSSDPPQRFPGKTVPLPSIDTLAHHSRGFGGSGLMRYSDGPGANDGSGISIHVPLPERYWIVFPSINACTKGRNKCAFSLFISPSNC